MRDRYAGSRYRACRFQRNRSGTRRIPMESRGPRGRRYGRDRRVPSLREVGCDGRVDFVVGDGLRGGRLVERVESDGERKRGSSELYAKYRKCSPNGPQLGLQRPERQQESPVGQVDRRIRQPRPGFRPVCCRAAGAQSARVLLRRAQRFSDLPGPSILQALLPPEERSVPARPKVLLSERVPRRTVRLHVLVPPSTTRASSTPPTVADIQMQQMQARSDTVHGKPAAAQSEGCKEAGLESGLPIEEAAPTAQKPRPRALLPSQCLRRFGSSGGDVARPSSRR